VRNLVNVVVTGGRGFIGRFVVEKLVEKGYTVIATGLGSSPFREHPKVIYRVVDVTDVFAMNRLLAEYKPEAIIHLAALLADVCEVDPVKCYKVNLEATQNLIELSIAHKVEKFVFMSSSAVYNPETPEPVREEDAGKPILYYGITKYVGELIGLWYTRKGLIDFRALRPTVVFGPGRYRGFSAQYSSTIIENALRGEKIVVKNLDMKVNYVYVKDVAEAVVLLLEAPKAPSRIYNVGGFVCSIGEFIDIVRKYIPSIQVEIVPGQYVRFPAVVDTSRIRNELGWKPVYLYEKAVEDYIELIKKGNPLFDIYT